ncbi:hypothetical protein ACM66B_004271 [Microbotryomycetes sp. NB124-2]
MSRLAPPFNSRFFFHDDELSRQPRQGPSDEVDASPQRPNPLKRSNSAMSLPSPPDDISPSFLQARHSLGDIDMSAVATDDEVDELESDDNDEPSSARRQTNYTTRSTSLQLSHDSNPFSAPARRVQGARIDSVNEGHLRVETRAQLRAPAPQVSAESVHMSPTDRARRRRQDRERIIVDDLLLGPKSMGRGWDSPGNPFIDRPAAVASLRNDQPSHGQERDQAEPWTPGQAVKPDRLTYVFRGKRVTYDIPFDALVAAEDPDDDPFPETKPRLLFPPAAGPPVTPPSLMSTSASISFLDALRNGAATIPQTAVIPASPVKQGTGGGLPPTPVTGKRRGAQSRNGDGGGDQQSRFGPYKKLRLGDSPQKRVLKR